MTEKPEVDQLHSDCKSVSTLAPIHENKSKTLSDPQFLPFTSFDINAFQWSGAFYFLETLSLKDQNLTEVMKTC